MVNRKSIITTGEEIYHIYNRGVDKSDIFLDKNDYYRFIHYLYEFNDTTPAIHPKLRVRGRTSGHRKRELLVEIICYCLMPNHFHLVLKQLKNNGITQFLHKISTGYALYINKKYKRSGSLFQGRFKDVHIANNEYLLHLTRYIHLNPIVKDKADLKLIKEKLESFRFSSYLDYIGNENFPSLISNDIIMDQFSSNDYKGFVEDFQNEKVEIILGLTLE